MADSLGGKNTNELIIKCYHNENIFLKKFTKFCSAIISCNTQTFKMWPKNVDKSLMFPVRRYDQQQLLGRKTSKISNTEGPLEIWPNAMQNKTFCTVQDMATNHMCLLNIWNVVSVTKQLNFKFYFILLYFNLNNHIWLLATI